MELQVLSCRTCGNKFNVVPDMDEVKPIIAMDEIIEQLTAWKVQVAREDGLPQFMCSLCIAEFQKVVKLKSSCLETQAKFVHMRSLELYVAPLNKSMLRDSALQRRMAYLNVRNAHLDPKPKSWECLICAKQFSSNQESRYKFHMKWHKLERRLKCPMCRFSCRSKLNLKAHKRAMHQFIKCSSCGKQIRKHLLHRHSNKHLEDREPKMAIRLNLQPQPPVNLKPVASTSMAAPSIAIRSASEAAATAVATLKDLAADVAIPEAPTEGVTTAPTVPAASRRYSLRVASATRQRSNALKPSNKTELGQKRKTMP